MNQFKLTILLIIPFLTTSLFGGNSVRKDLMINPERASGLFRPYPADSIGQQTDYPDGYRPFYVSHYGRHGSRWMTSLKEYRTVADPLERADSMNALTQKGKALLDKVQKACEQASGIEGSLSPLGVRQHRGIAERMFTNFPDVFANDGKIDARSTLTVRCVLSMNAFCMRLKELNALLPMTFESSSRSTATLGHIYGIGNPVDPDYKDYQKNGEYLKRAYSIVRDKMDSESFLNSIFTGNVFTNEQEKMDFIFYLFYLVCNQQNVMPENRIWDIYSPEELYWMTVAENYRATSKFGPHPDAEKWTLGYAVPMLQDMVERADRAVNGDGNAADLRFGHDIVLMGLIPLMGVDGYQNIPDDPEEVLEKWDLYDITPMGANIQVVFYHPLDKSRSDILVKVLFNEKEASLPIKTDNWPYYRWQDVRNHFTQRINKYKIE